MIDREERAAYERRRQRREEEAFDAQYARHQYRESHDSPLRKFDPSKPSTSLRHRKQITPYDSKPDSERKVNRA